MYETLKILGYVCMDIYGYLPYQLASRISAVSSSRISEASRVPSRKKPSSPIQPFAPNPPIRPGHRMDHLAIVQHLFGRLMHLPWHLAIGVEVGGPGWLRKNFGWSDNWSKNLWNRHLIIVFGDYTFEISLYALAWFFSPVVTPNSWGTVANHAFPNPRASVVIFCWKKGLLGRLNRYILCISMLYITSSLSEKPTVFSHNSNGSVGSTLKTLQVNYKIQSHVGMDSPILNREMQKKIFHWRGKHKVRCK